ncbi:MAG: type II secretion system F family protein [Bacilli bacterium]|nr:type II secretion system F family protein [Bacilli bacterium]
MDYIGFDKFEQIIPINTDLTINFNPDTNFSSYKLIIYKDNNIYKELNKIKLVPTTFTLSETGTYKIEVKYYDSYMNETIINSGIYNIDKEAPILNVGEKYIEVNLGSKLNIMSGVSATDNFSKNLNIITNLDNINFNTKGIKKITYTVSDEAGNITNKDITIKVLPSSSSIIIFQSFFIIILFMAIALISLYNKSIKLEKRIARFSITPLKDNTISLFDKLIINIRKIIKTINKYLYKSKLIKKYSNRYQKYVNGISEMNRTSIDFVSLKIICSFACLIIGIFSKTMQMKIFHIYDSYLPLIFGFFIPDFIYYFKYKAYKQKLENDLLQAIIIMNNAFKSGRSIAQAIDLVANELTGPMAEEFKKMHLELSFGLGIDIVFNRFSNRINIEEAAYLTASLTILNKSGGNIIEVFSSIEKSLFNKKKLRLQLLSLTSGSRMIVNILTIIPIVFIMLIYFINPSYFLPLFTNPLGYIIIGFTIVYYITYIIVVRKALKVNL